MDDIYARFANDPLVPMTLRLAVAGHRHHPNIESADPRLHEQIRWVYRTLHRAFEHCQQHPYAKGLYANEPGQMRLISSLAEGADQLLVDPELVGTEMQLSCILPFSASVYADDFDGTPKQRFQQLLNQADYASKGSRVVELDGSRGDSEHAYRQCGQVLIKNCDMLIALYDGKERPGFGTSWTVRKALKAKMPVVWIDIEAPYKVQFMYSHGGQTQTSNFDKANVSKWLEGMLLFTNIMQRRTRDQHDNLSDQILEKFADYKNESSVWCDPEQAPDLANNGPVSTKNSRFNPLHYGYTWLRRSLLPAKKAAKRYDQFSAKAKTASLFPTPTEEQLSGFKNPSGEAFFAAYLRADRLASHYAALHRSIFVYIYLLGAMALIIAALAIALSDKSVYGNLSIWCGGAELVILLLIFFLYRKDHSKNYHDKWLEYRCIAEFLRPTMYLSFFASAYPMGRFRDSEETLGRNTLGHGGPERCWTYLYVETLLRWVGIKGSQIDPDYKQTALTVSRSQWLGEQYEYHTRNAFYMNQLGHKLANISATMFWITMVVIGIKILVGVAGVKLVWLSMALGLLAAWLPVVGTTAFAIRNHAEFEISAQRSLSTRETLLGFNRKLAELQANDCQLDEIDNLLSELGAVTISETADWLEIYEVKEAETA